VPIPPISDLQTTDERLMLAFADGDKTAFEELFLRYRQSIYAFYRRRIVDQARAEELTQETFLALLRAAGRYQPRALFRPYLFAIAFRILSADRRKSALRAFLFLSAGNNEPSETPAPEEVLWLRQAVSRLEKTDREILLLREFEQFSYLEIAELLRMPVNTVRSRLFRARLALQEILLSPRGERAQTQISAQEESV
jgi:RNA polymerase sigma-70 factor, ECF subfamily